MAILFLARMVCSVAQSLRSPALYRGFSSISGTQHHADRPYGAGGGTDITARCWRRTSRPYRQAGDGRKPRRWWRLGRLGLARAGPAGWLHVGYLNVPLMFAGYLDRQYDARNARQLHAADEPRARLQCLGSEVRLLRSRA